MRERLTKDPAKAAACARDLSTPVEILAELAKSELVFLREDVILHPNATPELLSSLLPVALENDADRRIAAALVSNPLTPPAVLATLLRLLNPDVINGRRRENGGWENLVVGLLSHQNISPTDVVAFLQTVNLPKGIKVRVAERSSTEGVLKILHADKSEIVRRAAATRLELSTYAKEIRDKECRKLAMSGAAEF